MGTKIIPFFIISIFISCSKEKVPKPIVPIEQNKWEAISGKYLVYDTVGVFLYELEITHKTGLDSLGKQIDSLCFNNFDGQFTFSTDESEANYGSSNYPKNYFYTGDYYGIKDKNNKRWRILGLTNDIYNSLIGDTIKLRFNKCNIIYYLEDCTPYFCEVVKQVAVKKH